MSNYKSVRLTRGAAFARKMLPRKASTRDAVETAIEKARDPKAKWTWLDA